MSGSRFRPRIVIVAPTLGILGGQGVQAAWLFDALRADGHDVTLLPVNPAFPAGLRWVRGVPWLRTVLNQLLYLPSLVRLWRADVAHVFSAAYWSFLLAPAPAILAAKIFGRRVVLHYHSGEADDHLRHWGALVHPWLRCTDEIVVPSAFLQRVFAAHGYTARVICNIVRLERYRFRPRVPIAPRLLSIRNLEPYYRVDMILDAFAIVRRARPDATLTVAGVGSLEADLRAQARRLDIDDAVSFTGRVEPDDMPALFDAADVFVNASVLDNQPVSILEAFAAGTPVITTPPGDIPAMVDDGVTGVIVPDHTPAGLAGAVLSLIASSDRAAALALRAVGTLSRYSWPAVRPAWQNVHAPAPTCSIVFAD